MKTTPSRHRIVLADDHGLVRSGIRALLGQIPGVTVVGEASGATEALALVRELQPDFLLSDLAMHDGGGFAVLDAVRREKLPVRILILSMHANEEYVRRALRAGAAGYLIKDAAPDELALAMAALARGETYLSPALSRAVMSNFLGTREEPLTPRQRQTLQLIAEGRTTKEIADHLGVGIKTVETHRAQIRERLGIPDIAGLVKYAQRTGLIPPEA